MEENKNNVEKINDEKAENVFGGFVGKDWGKQYQAIYSRWGIRHEQNVLGKDKYYIGDQEIPKKFVYKLVDGYLNAPYEHGKDWNDMDEYIQKNLGALRNMIKEGDLDAINKIWQDYK